MKKIKKLTSAFLAVIIALGTLTVAPFTVSAAGNSFDAPTSYTIGSTVNGSITSTNKEDYYKFSIPTSGKITLDLTAYIVGSEYYIYDSEKSKVWNYGSWGYAGWNDTTKVLKFSNDIDLTSGTYYLLIKRYGSYTGKAANEQRTNWLAEKRALIGTDEQYTQEWYNKQREQANKDYDAAVEEANKLCGDTINILQQGYYDRADALKKYTEELKQLNQDEIDENTKYNDNIKSINNIYNKDLLDFINEEKDNRLAAYKYKEYLGFKNKEIEEEKTRHTKAQGDIRNKQQKILDDENYRNQVAAFTTLEALYETYTGKTGKHSEEIVSAFFIPMKNIPKDTKEKFQSAVEGAIKGLDERKDTLFYKATEIAGGFINRFRKMFNINSPSRVFKKIFKYVIEGGEVGVDDEAPKLYKQADDVASTFSKRMQAAVSADGLVSKMKAAVSAGRAFVAQKLTANIVHEVEMHNDDNNRKYFFKGDVVTHLNIDGREFAVVTAPYMSEELAWEVK